MSNSRYIPRSELITYMAKVAAALERGTDPLKVAAKLRRAVATLEATPYINVDEHAKLVKLVRRRPGLTYREAADLLGDEWSPMKVRQYAQTNRDIYSVELPHRRATFGRKPHGLFLVGKAYRHEGGDRWVETEGAIVDAE